MTYQLILGNRLYFSWSIAAYLMVGKFGLSRHFIIQIVHPQAEFDVARFLKDTPPARTLPTMITPEGVVVYIPAFSPDTLEMLTPVSKSPSISPLTNPVMVYVKAGSIAPYTLVSESAVMVKGAAVMLRSPVP